MSLEVGKLTNLWSRYRATVDFANRTSNVEVHRGLFGIFCLEFTFRLEQAYDEYRRKAHTGYETMSLKDFSTLVRWDIVTAFEMSYLEGTLHDAFQIVTDETEDGRTRFRLFYRRDDSVWRLDCLEYDVTFPMLNEIERDEVYARFL